MAWTRAFTAPTDENRCNGSVQLKDKSRARCMHRRQGSSDFCHQHQPEQSRDAAADRAAFALRVSRAESK